MIVLTVCVVMGQILSGAMGIEHIDETTWDTPSMLTRVKEINIHERHTFEVITRKNGRKLTITPALLKSMADAQKSRTEQQRTAALAKQYKSSVASLYACPFKMSSCNGRSMACARCKQRLMNGDLVLPPRAKNQWG